MYNAKFALLAGFLLTVALPATARTPVDLELVLAVDSSASVDAHEFHLQVQGMSRAFRDTEVLAAIQSGPNKAIAVSVVEWASNDLQTVNVPWMLIDGPTSARWMADSLDGMSRSIAGGATSISGALRFSAALFHNNGFTGLRRVIDLSCDGRNNQGPVVEVIRDVLVGRGVAINGLTILNEHPTLNYYFRQRIIGGPGAFVEIAKDYNAYADAFVRKLIREIRNVPISTGPASKERLRRASVGPSGP